MPNGFFLVDCDFDKRPVLDWNGYGEVPYHALPKDDVTGWAILPVKIENPYREDFESVFLNNVDCILEFSGVIKQITKNGIMFDKVLFTDDSCYWDYVTEYCEKHVWIRSKHNKVKLPADIKAGDTIGFFARIMLYRRKNGTLDYGLTDFDYIDKVEERTIPTTEELDKQHKKSFLHRLRCETCLLYDKCDMMNCIMF